MSTDVVPLPPVLIDLSKYNLADLTNNPNKPLSAALQAAIDRVTTDAEDADATKICAFNSAI